MKAPQAKKIPYQHKLHDDVRDDPYAWLRDDNWQAVMKSPQKLKPAIRKYLEAENEYTEWAMHDTHALQDELFREMKGRIQEDEQSVPFPDGDFEYYWRYNKGGQHRLFCRSPRGQSDQETILVDGDKLSKGHSYFNLAQSDHSPDHKIISYAVDTKGSEYFTLNFLNADDKKALKDKISDCRGGLEWAADAQHFFYIRLDDNHRPCQVYRHKMGTPQSADVLVYEEKDPSFSVGLSKSTSGDFIFIELQDHQSTEVWFLRANQPMDPATLIATREAEIEYWVEHWGEKFFILTNTNKAEDFKVVETSIERPGRDHWVDVIRHRSGCLISNQIIYQNYHVRLERENALPRIVVSQLNKAGTLGAEHIISFEEEAFSLGVSFGYEFDTDILRFVYSSPTTPQRIFDYDMATQTRQLRKSQIVPSGHKPENYHTKRLMIEAEDGEDIPVTLLYRTNLKLSEETPVLLYGYGSYGHALPASFSANRLSLVDRGFVYAIAHIRGGMEKGFRWYREGKRLYKKNTFNDFITVATGLINLGYTSHGRIVAHGGSAGGMLMGTIANMAPELFGGIIADVPFVDVLTTICDPSLPLTPPEWTEWGNPIRDKNVYAYMKSYSPYDNVVTQTYPPILATAGLTDPRVTYWEPAKWIAKLRALKTDKNLCLLKTNMEAGHAGAAGRFDYLKEVAFNYAFALMVIEL